MRDSDLVAVRNALVLGLADLVAYRDVETVSHALRLQGYCRVLAEEAARCPSFAAQIDRNFVQMLECCAPLHDIGKAGLPDHILTKTSNLDAEERLAMQNHTLIGAETCKKWPSGTAKPWRSCKWPSTSPVRIMSGTTVRAIRIDWLAATSRWRPEF